MTKISIYNKDTDVRGNDKWIGSDAQNQNRTKNFTPDNVAAYFNENQVIDLGVELRYFYDTLDPLQERVYGSITFETEIGPQVNFSSISTFILSKYTMGHTDVSQFLDFLIGSNVLLSRSNNINMFGYYKIDNIEPYLPDPNFFVVTLTFENGNGYMKEDEDYFISLVQFEQTIPDVPTKTSDLINDGQDGVHPFITAEDVPTPTLQSVTDQGDTTTTTVYLNGGAISESINEQAVFAPAQVSTVNLNSGSGATLDSTGKLALSPDGLVSSLFAADNITQSITLQSPNKAPGSYTLATTDDIPAVTGFVPYTGANQNVNLGEYELKAGQLTLDTTPTGTSVVGTTQWNDTTGVSETKLKGGNVVLKNGVDLVARVVNKVTPNATLLRANYTAVRISGAQGQRLAVAYAQANNDNNSADTLGLVYEDIATNQEGFIMTMGQFEEINTTGSLQGETWADGDVLYLSPTTAGRITNIKPTGLTGHIVVMGYVEYAHANHGKIYVKIMNGWELDELHNVYINSPLNNDGLFYDSADSLWKNKTIAAALGYTPENVANKSTSTSLGTSDTLYPTQNAVKVYADTKFTLPSLTSGSVLFSNGTTIAQDNSNLFWDDTNNRLGIGTVTPAYGLDVNGTARVSGNTAINSGSELFSLGVVGRKPFRLFTSNGDKGCLRLERDGVINVNLSSDSAQFGASYISNTNFLVGTTTDAGFRLDVNGTARVSDISYLTLGARIGTTTTAAGIFPSGTSGRESLNLRSSLLPTDTGNDVVITNGQGDVANTSSIRSLLTVARSFSPTSGTGIYNLIQVNPTINQTGGANGITRGLYINPTLTAAADFRAIETTAGNVLFGASGTGFFWDNTNNRLGIGTNNPSSRLQINTNNLGTTVTDASGVILENNTPSVSSGATTQFSPSLIFKGSAWNPLVTGSQVASFKIFNSTAAQGIGTQILSSLNFQLSKAGGAYSSAMTLTNDQYGATTLSFPNGHVITSTNGTLNFSTVNLSFSNGLAATSNLAITQTISRTSGTATPINVSATIIPTSGTGETNVIQFTGTINQTGGANGITRGLYVNPTLTAAADFRAIENSVGKVCLNTTSGNTMIGTTTDAGFKLDVNGTARVSGELTVNGVNIGLGGGAITTNTRVGLNAGQSNTTGAYNSFFGRSAGQSNTTGANNSFFGVYAGYSNTTGANNSFFGVYAGFNNTTGNSNSFFGLNAGFNNTTGGSSNSFFGVNAGQSNTTGSSNSFFGVNSGFSNTTGNSNSFFGLNAGFNNTTGGSSNSFFGVNAGLSNTTGSSNSFFGQSAGLNTTIGSNNSFVGTSAGRYIADGITNLTAVDNSVFLGNNTRANTNSETNQIVIGHNAIGAGSNTATLGNTSIVDTILRGRINIQQYATGSRPTYVKGALIYDSTLGKLVIGGNSGWEVVTSV